MAEPLVRRSLLFVPANRPQLFDKALAGPADMVCLELEDGVGPDHKDQARAHMLSFFADADRRIASGQRILTRINHPATDEGKADIEAVLSLHGVTAGIMIPKISSADELTAIDARLRAGGFDGPLFILIETALGLEHSFDIVRASDRLEMVLFGGVDLAADLRCTPGWEPLLYARQRLVHAVAGTDTDLMDMPWLNIADTDGLYREAVSAAHLGFTGKAAVHPAQLDNINKAFTPTPEQVLYAQSVVAAYQQSATGVCMLDGRLVEKPVVDRMKRVLALARAAGIAN